MPGHGRTIGAILIAVAVVVLLASLVWLVAEPTTGGEGRRSAFSLCCWSSLLPLGGGGLYLLTKGRQETAEFAEIAKQKKILNMVLAQGKVTLSEVALELGAPMDKVEEMVRDLVGKNLFSGAINWKDGVLYSKQAADMKAEHKCPNCAGELELAGKGVIKCPFCGSEVFLAS